MYPPLPNRPRTRRITREEFCERFREHLVKLAPPERADETRAYADTVVGEYIRDGALYLGPEGCAEAEASYWEAV